MEWQERLWQTITPTLPAGRVGLWIAPPCRPVAWKLPPTVLPHWHDPAAPTPATGAALQGLLLLGCGPTALPWPALLGQLAPLLAPQAPLLLLVPRGGLVALPSPAWHSSPPAQGWRRALVQTGWRVEQQCLLGGASWPGPWATAALRLYGCQRDGLIPATRLPTRLQFNSRRAGTASATG